jgi:thymidylate synthase
MSLNVNDIPGGPPAIWKAVADKDGFINSNYGWCIYSPENGFSYNDHERADSMWQVERAHHYSQFKRCVQELWATPESRRAMMIYTRPSMWLDYNKNGRSDFMCTNAVQYLIRDGAVHAIIQMRSNDAVFGFKNDRAWQQHVLEKVTNELNSYSHQRQTAGLEPICPIYDVGNLYWNAGSLHVYERHFHLVDPTWKKET